MIVNPTIGSFELHLYPSADFTAKGWGRKLRKLGGDFRAARGHDDIRFVFVPNTEPGRKLCGELLARFARHLSTTVIVNTQGEARRFMGDAGAPTCVHYVKNTADPHAAIDKVIAAFQRRYARLVRRAFWAKSHAWFRRAP